MSRQEPITAQHEIFEFVHTCVNAGVNPMLVGPSGCGKTTVSRTIATAMDLPFYYTGAVESSFQLKGFTDAQGRIVETSFVKAYRDGGLFLFDEIDASDPFALVAVHAALDNGIFDAPEGIINRHADFHFIAAANTWGHGATLDYMGRNPLDGATLDRFVLAFMDYDPVFERELVAAKYPNQTGWVDIVHKARAAARELSLRHIISTRAHLKGAALLDAGLSRDCVIDSVLLGGLEADTKVKMLEPINRVSVVVPVTSVSAPIIVPATPASPPPAASAASFTDPRIGEYVPGEGIFMGWWTPRDKDGKPVGIECELWASRKDLKHAPNVGEFKTYLDTVKGVAGLKDWYGHDGGNFENDTAVIASLIDGSGIGKWFIPPRDVLYGKDAKGNSQDANGNPIYEANLYALRNRGDFKDSFITARGSANARRYWSSTVYCGALVFVWDVDASVFVWDVDFSDGGDGWDGKNLSRLSCRPCRVGKVRPLTI